ncbi:MAG: DUF6089 family protein [Bacteroidota bacterium]
MKKVFIFILLSFSTLSLQAQDFEVGGWLGTSVYFGDLNTNFSFKRPGVAGGIVGRYNFNPRVAVKASASYAHVSYDDALSPFVFQRTRNLDFSSHIIEGTFQLEFNFLKYEHGSDDHFWTPYVFGGLTVFYFNPRTKFNDEWVALQPLGTEGQAKNSEYSRTQPAFAFGGGLKFDLNYAWSINFEVSGRYLFTDFLDDVSGVYPDFDDLATQRGNLAVLLSDPSYQVFESQIGEPGRQRGNSKDNDSYNLIGISLLYNFASIKCPTKF